MSHDDQILSYSRFFRLIRPLAYSNEVGESFRHVYPKVIPYAYALSFGYVGLDIARNVMNSKHKKQQFLDSTCFHLSASIVLPTATIYSISHISKQLCFSLPNRYRIWLPVVTSLSSIPFIIHPIDNSTDRIMNKYIRPKIWNDL